VIEQPALEAHSHALNGGVNQTRHGAVLVVDDDPDQRDLLRILLSTERYVALSLVEQMLSSPDAGSTLLETRRVDSVVAMFADLRGFARIYSTLDVGTAVDILNVFSRKLLILQNFMRERCWEWRVIPSTSVLTFRFRGRTRHIAPRFVRSICWRISHLCRRYDAIPMRWMSAWA